MTRPPRAPRPKSQIGVLREFFAGFGVLGRGFALWRRRPGLMMLGLVPAFIVAVATVALIVLLAANVQGLTTLLTPFANGWDPQWSALFRIALGLALVIGAVVLFAFGFTALTLTVGDPFYERIWRAVENDLGGFPEGQEGGFWRSVADSLRLVVRATFTAGLLALIGLLPLVGTALAAVLGVFFSGRIIALELTARPFEARGITRRQRRDVLRTRNPRTLGFGVAVQLCFLVPGDAVLVMPAAVAGATYLARQALDATAASAPLVLPPPLPPPPPPTPPASPTPPARPIGA